MSTPIRPVKFEQVALQTHPEKTPKPTAIDGTPADSAVSLWERSDGKVLTGTWECTPGRFVTSRDGINEVVYILSGRGTLIADDGTETEYQPGDAIALLDGFTGEWHVRETTRKVYFVSATA